MAHEILRGELTKSFVEIWASSENENGEYRDIVAEWEIGNRRVAGWLRQFTSTPRTLAIISGNALAGILSGDIWAHETDTGHSEITTGSAESMDIGGHDIGDFLERIGEGCEVVLILLDPELDGDISEVLCELAGFPVEVPSEGN